MNKYIPSSSIQTTRGYPYDHNRIGHSYNLTNNIANTSYQNTTKSYNNIDK